MNTIIERDNLLRRMASLQEQNKRLEERSSTLHSDIFGDMGALRTDVQRQEQLLKKNQDPVLAQVQPYKPLETTVEEPQRRDLEKGKQKVVGVQINEPQPLSKSIPCGMTQLDLELEKSRKEREDLAKELEKVENEAQAAEARRKIMFIKSNSALTVQSSQPPLVLPSAPVVGALTVGQSAPLFPPLTTPVVASHFPSL